MGVLDGKAAIVTGSARGIGRATAELLAEHGARVLISDLDADVAEQASSEITGETAVFGGDLTKEGVPDELVQKAVDEFGQLDILVNNAGYTRDSVAHKMTDEQFQAMLDVHLVAPFRIMRAASEPIRVMAKKEAEAGREVFRKVVNISSIAGLYGNAGQASYSSAKASLIGLTRTMCKEWGRYNVNVNAVAFGFIETRLTSTAVGGNSTIDIEGKQIKVGVNPDLLGMMTALIPLGRPGTPDEAAGSVVMLTYPEADYVSGQIMVTGGGFEA